MPPAIRNSSTMTSLKLPSADDAGAPVMRYRWPLCQWGRERLRCDRETGGDTGGREFPPSARPPITWSTRSSTRPCRTSRGSRPPRRRPGVGSAGAAGGRDRLFQLGGGAGPRARGAHGSHDRRRPGAQPASHPDAGGHPGPAGRRPRDRHAPTRRGAGGVLVVRAFPRQAGGGRRRRGSQGAKGHDPMKGDV